MAVQIKVPIFGIPVCYARRVVLDTFPTNPEMMLRFIL